MPGDATERDPHQRTGDDVRRVVHPHVDAAPAHDRGDGVPEHVAVARVGQDRCRGERVAWPEGNDEGIGWRIVAERSLGGFRLGPHPAERRLDQPVREPRLTLMVIPNSPRT